ncbi:hypothetical protein ACIRQQ_07880 [Streptomyces fuscichromogenes]|uniref:hypothetical protein n=1 Tax=Streptomyces fuscichromogenes TaxID=1324013 RepID=UPI003819CE01
MLTERQLGDWGLSHESATRVAAEPAADARGDRVPCGHEPVAADVESGRGLLIVEAYAHRWGVDEAPTGCKTVWAESAEPGREDP